MSLRNRYFELDASQPLPWGDPYIVKLFRVSVTEPTIPTNSVIYNDIVRDEALPPLYDPTPDFDTPRRQADDWTFEEPGDE